MLCLQFVSSLHLLGLLDLLDLFHLDPPRSADRLPPAVHEHCPHNNLVAALQFHLLVYPPPRRARGPEENEIILCLPFRLPLPPPHLPPLDFRKIRFLLQTPLERAAAQGDPTSERG